MIEELDQGIAEDVDAAGESTEYLDECWDSQFTTNLQIEPRIEPDLNATSIRLIQILTEENISLKIRTQLLV